MSDLTRAQAQRIIRDESLTATANLFGRTGRRERSAWIDREGDEWIVWETDERGEEFFAPSRFSSEAEALDLFLRMARAHKAADSTAVRRVEGTDMAALTAEGAQHLIREERLTATANWFGRTGRTQSAAWIDRDGEDWIVWETDERGGRFHAPLRFRSEAEALDLFIRIARRYRTSDAHAERRPSDAS